MRAQPHPRDSREPDPRPSESRELSPACAPVKPVAPHLAPPSERGCHSSPQLAPASRPSRSPGSLQHRAGRRPPSLACPHAGPGAQPAGLGPAGSSRARPPPPVPARPPAWASLNCSPLGWRRLRRRRVPAPSHAEAASHRPGGAGGAGPGAQAAAAGAAARAQPPRERRLRGAGRGLAAAATTAAAAAAARAGAGAGGARCLRRSRERTALWPPAPSVPAPSRPLLGSFVHRSARPAGRRSLEDALTPGLQARSGPFRDTLPPGPCRLDCTPGQSPLLFPLPGADLTWRCRGLRLTPSSEQVSASPSCWANDLPTEAWGQALRRHLE